jgi:hypothetical protein
VDRRACVTRVKIDTDGMWVGEQANAGGVNSVGIRLS